MKNEELIVLVVDDSPLIVDRLTGTLKELDNVGQILDAGSFSEAMGILGKQKPDVLLLDINLPDRSGIELLRFISENNWRTRVIMVTNNSNDYYRNLCGSLGAYHFFDKSNELEKLPDVIRQVQISADPV